MSFGGLSWMDSYQQERRSNMGILRLAFCDACGHEEESVIRVLVSCSYVMASRTAVREMKFFRAHLVSF